MPQRLPASRRAVKIELELSAVRRLISLDVRPAVSLSALGKHLDAGRASGRWDYEEGSVREERLRAEG